MSPTTVPERDDAAPLTTRQSGWVERAIAYLAEPEGVCRVASWDVEAGHKRVPTATMRAADAIRAGRTVVARHRPSVVLLDLDTPEEPLAPGVVPADRVAAVWAAALLGLVVEATPSGTVRHGLAALNGAVDTPSEAHAEALVALVAHKVGNCMIARTGSWARALMSPGYKPWHVAGLPESGGVLDVDGQWVPMSVEDVAALAASLTPVSEADLPALLRAHGVAVPPTAAEALFKSPPPVNSATASVSHWLEALTPELRDVAHTDGSRYSDEDPSRHPGEMAVVCGLVREGATVGDVHAVLSAMPIGDRMRREIRDNGRRVEKRSPRAQRLHVERMVARAEAFIAAGGSTGGARPRLGEAGRARIEAAWTLDVDHDARVAFAALAAVHLRLDREVVGLSQLQLALETSMDGATAMRALRAHPCVEVVEPGTPELATTWRIVDPPEDAVQHWAPERLPSLALVAEVAASDLAAAGVLGGRERALPILVTATLLERVAGPAELGRLYYVTGDQAGVVLKRLRDAGVAERVSAGHRVADPLWLRAILMGVHGETDLKAAAQARRRQRRPRELSEHREKARARNEALAGDPGDAAVRVDPDPVLEPDDPARAAADAFVAGVDLPARYARLDVEQVAVPVALHALEATGGDLDRAVLAATTTATAVTAWAWAQEPGEPVTAGPVVVAVAVRAIDRLLAGVPADEVFDEACADGAARVGLTLKRCPPEPVAVEPAVADDQEIAADATEQSDAAQEVPRDVAVDFVAFARRKAAALHARVEPVLAEHGAVLDELGRHAGSPATVAADRWLPERKRLEKDAGRELTEAEVAEHLAGLLERCRLRPDRVPAWLAA